MKVCIVSSVGGHLSEVLQLRPCLEGHDLCFVLNDHKILSDDLRGRTHFISHAERDWRTVYNLWECFRILRREQPDVVISTGAGPAVPAFLVAGRLGIHRIFIESFCAVHRPSLTGRLIHAFRSFEHLFYQWPHLASALPAGEYAGIVYPVTCPIGARRGGGGIFVTLGNATQPFARLVRMLEQALPAGERHDVVWQLGSTAVQPTFGELHAVLPSPRFRSLLETSRVVVCHAGAGTVMEAIQAGHRPIVVPRLVQHGELVSDHQLDMALELQRLGWVQVANSAEELRLALLAGTTRAPADWCPTTLPTLHARIRELLA
jgi:UDP-N-acetylglucosamine transferase subunit ALG13